VNVSSVGGMIGYAGFAAYAASKHGLIGLTRSAALEYARDGIRINAVCPGATETAMLERITAHDDGARERLAASKPMGRLATAEEVAECIVWLCGPSASYILGQALPIDGGMLAGQPRSDR
jgi:NAD(P)-dependent dehydrogenase (short-subunit alcohol dehydrogenase family)